MKKKFGAVLIAGLLVASTFTACGGDKTPSTSSESTGKVASGPDDTSEPYKFTVYCNYDWWTVKPWGEDLASKFLKEKFNVDVEWTKPDADPAAKLNIMISSGDIPEAMVMDRNADLLKVAKQGLLVDLEQFKYEGNPYDENILPQTQDLLKIDGKLYSIPNWARKSATGGNYSWLINQEVWRAVGSPELKTLEDVHQFALKVKKAGLKTQSGEGIIPFMTGDTPDALKVYNGFYRSYGATNIVENYFSYFDGKTQFIMRDPVFKNALKEANKWFNEGLFSETIVTDSVDQVNEKLSNGRPAIAYYDFSQDSVNHFRQILIDSTKGKNSYEVLTDPIFPHAEGVDKVYGEENTTVGYNVNIITKNAKNPQRIFDLFSYMLTKEGSINMMYGPKGELWEELDENGNPILKVPESKLSAEQKDKVGCWFWSQPAHSDNVDLTKFAINNALPKEDQDFTITLQANVFTGENEGCKFITDENVGLGDTIDPTEDLGIKRKLIVDTLKASIPKIIFAKNDAEFNKLYDEAIKFADDNSMAEIEKRYDEKHKANCELQGGSYYDKK